MFIFYLDPDNRYHDKKKKLYSLIVFFFFKNSKIFQIFFFFCSFTPSPFPKSWLRHCYLPLIDTYTSIIPENYERKTLFCKTNGTSSPSSTLRNFLDRIQLIDMVIKPNNFVGSPSQPNRNLKKTVFNPNYSHKYVHVGMYLITISSDAISYFGHRKLTGIFRFINIVKTFIINSLQEY